MSELTKLKDRLLAKPTRSGYIDLLRFFGSISVALYHGEHVFIDSLDSAEVSFQWSGYIWVDFFFLLSGYFAMRFLAKNDGKLTPSECGKAAGSYIWKKYKGILPYSTVGILVAWHWKCAAEGITGMKEALKIIAYLPVELLLQDRTGAFINHAEADGPLWYLCAMLIVLPFLVYIGLRSYGLIKGVLCWAIPCVLYGFLIRQNGTVIASGGDNYDVFIRAAAGLLLGCFAYVLSEEMKRRRATVLLRALLFAAELGSLYLIYRAGDLQESAGEYSLIIVLLFFVIVTVAFSGLTPTSMLKSRLLTLLGKLSLPVFTTHFAFRTLLWGTQLYKNYTYNETVARFLGWTIGFSLFLLVIWEVVWPVVWHYLKRLFFRPAEKTDTEGAGNAPAADAPAGNAQ